ncbi:helix-turn-helix domain-containing protein [Hyperthermus butylicus]|uniref:HTH iclR-type domain-containing protein n=1 Tax=Hyperthermus butylicus (strain DSM 5456 / JCM 9403 / PLM1-5) TaxID=415426 RepID=A2BJM9_HYPBU|nr:helix-turn-helix domain-containing protein [Hyperthermus butylicus]ABM80190.1 hypothetical protein Hbut_0318 [Hyperthermus butylicus DSM 5456]
MDLHAELNPYIYVAALGNDESHIVRGVLRLQPMAVLVFAESTGSKPPPTTLKALETIRKLAELAGAIFISRSIRLSVHGIPSMVYEIRRSVLELADSLSLRGEHIKAVYVTACCGSPHVNTALAYAALILAYHNPSLSVRIYFSKPENEVVEDAGNLLPAVLDATGQHVLRVLVEKTLKEGSAGVSEIAYILSMSKSKVHKKLQQLVARGLAEKVGNRYRATRWGIANG